MKKKSLLLLGLPLLAVLLTIGVFRWKTEWRRTVADSSVSPDGVYSVELVAVGEADFPFGPARGELRMKQGNRRLGSMPFTLHDDGGCVRKDCWSVEWSGSTALVTIHGSEQEDEHILLTAE